MKKTNRSGVVSTPFYAILSNINPNFFHWLVAGQGSFVLHFLGQWGGRFFPPTTQGIRLSLLLALLVIQWTLASEQVQAQTCDCKEYIYLNEPDLPGILKFEVNSSSVGLTEVAGANGLPHWYPGTGSSELPNPHGLGTDLNGRLYIGSEGENSLIRQLTCDGVITPVSGTTINDPGTHQNIFSIGNILYTNRHGGPAAYNSCTGAFVGQMCLDGASSNLWGLSYNETTQMVYATQRFGSQKVWAFTRTQLEAGIASASCLNPIITLGPNAVVNPGENFLPNIPNSEVFGITSDNAGNMYVVVLVDRLGSATSYLYKYNAAGNFVSSVAFGLVGRAAIGIVWSETTNRLYTSHITDNPAVNCISAYDASTLAYLGTAAPNPGVAANNSAKAIAILKECCPVNLQSTFTKNVCGGIGQKFYLNEEAFNTCDGVVCGSSWTPTSLNGMTFDACDNSVEITGASGCSTFTLDIGAVSSTGCGAQSSTFTICNNPPPVISASASACAGSGYTLSGQVTFAAAPATSGTMTVSVAGGGSQVFNAPFTSPIAYSIAGLNGDGSSQTVSVNFSDGSGCMASANYVAPLCCAITLTPTVSGCYQRGGESRATVNVEVAWANPPAGGEHHRHWPCR